MDHACPKCGHNRSAYDLSQEECPKCGIVYAKFQAYQEKNQNRRQEEDAEKDRAEDTEISFKSRLFLIATTMLMIAAFLYPWYLYLYELRILFMDKRANASVNMVRSEGGGRSRRTYAYYSFVTDSHQVVDGRRATTGLRTGQPIVVAYNPHYPENNFPVSDRRGILLTLFFSLIFPTIFLMVLCGKHPYYRQYVKEKAEGTPFARITDLILK